MRNYAPFRHSVLETRDPFRLLRSRALLHVRELALELAKMRLLLHVLCLQRRVTGSSILQLLLPDILLALDAFLALTFERLLLTSKVGLAHERLAPQIVQHMLCRSRRPLSFFALLSQ